MTEKEKRQAYYQLHKEEIKAKRKEHYASNKEKILVMTRKWAKENAPKMRKYRSEWSTKTTLYANWHNAKRRARDCGVPFTIHYSDLTVPEVCPVLGLAFDSTSHEMRPSIDRVVPSLGYIPGNVQVISVRANRLKSDATLDELRKVTAYVEQNS